MANTYTGSDVGKAGLNVAEEDGSPSVFGVTKINVSDGTLTDNGGGEVTISTGGGGGGSPGGSDGQVQYNNGGSFGGASALAYDDANNRVGINTTSPEAKLEVVATTASEYGMVVDHANGQFAVTQYGGIHLDNAESTPNLWQISERDGESLDFAFGTPDSGKNVAASSTALRITSDGDVGIGLGSTDPSSILNIAEGASGTPRLLLDHNGDQSATANISFLDSTGGGNGQQLGLIDFRGQNSASEEIQYARIRSDSHVYTDASERGRIVFDVQRNGVLTEVMRWSGFEVAINEGSSDVNFKVESNNDDPLFFVDAGLDRVAVGLDNLESSPQAKFHVLNTSSSEFVALFQTNENGASAGPDVGIYRDSATPANNDDLGHLRFRGNHAATSGGSAAGSLDYADIFAEAVDVVTGSEDGRLSIRTSLGGSIVNRIYLDSTDTTINDGREDLDFIVKSVNSNQMLFVDAANDRVGIATNAPACELDVRGSDDSGFVDFRVSRDNDQFTGIRNSDASGGYLQNNSREGNKKPFYIESVHNEAGSAAGSLDILFRLGASSSPTERMRILESNGNVGIGISSPAQKLHVSGTIRQTNTTSAIVSTDSNGDLGSASIGSSLSFSSNTLDTQTAPVPTPQIASFTNVPDDAGYQVFGWVNMTLADGTAVALPAWQQL